MRKSAAFAAIAAAVGYYVGAEIGLALTLHPAAVSTLWPPNAILLAALLLVPVRSWWAILAAVLPAHIAVELGAGIPMPMVLSWYVSNCSEALIGAWLIRRVAALPVRLDSFAQVQTFVLAAGLIAPVVSSFLDAGFVSVNGWGDADYWQVWRARCLSNAVASLTFAPV